MYEPKKHQPLAQIYLDYVPKRHITTTGVNFRPIQRWFNLKYIMVGKKWRSTFAMNFIPMIMIKHSARSIWRIYEPKKHQP